MERLLDTEEWERVKKIIKTCSVCKRYNVKPVNVSAGFLPKDRVRKALVFEVIGVDLCGPMDLEFESIIYLCRLSSYIELVTLSSTDGFVQALRRFIALKGRPSVSYSNNVTDLVGTDNELKSVDWSRLNEFSSFRRFNYLEIQSIISTLVGWLLEASNRHVKNMRVLKNTCLDYEDLYTVL
ncbi:uncharacterized protein LOC118183786 [Stegodyphus dumicola]|uniref:uncharacterized protein LOC118183786 n=1 Tax=Stegodyphus dumicola TaxID=202533 RepID=UPI0015AA56A6|nr:uncharacterized protein LOC118183786 [Stegodyphus dumicola]